MKKVKPLQLLFGLIGLAIGVVGISALREATLSTHEEVEAEQIEVLIAAKTKGGEPGQSLDEMVEAQVLSCRLEVSSDVVGPIEDQGDGRYRAVLAPALDETNKRQFRGCMEDWVIDHVKLDVVDLNELD